MADAEALQYATVDDLESRWRTLTADEQSHADVLLEDASAMLSELVGVLEPESDGQARLLKIVCCNMVQRAMVAEANGAYGITQQTISADIYSQQLTYSNPSGDMYLTKTERKLLGIAQGYIGSIRPKIGDVDD